MENELNEQAQIECMDTGFLIRELLSRIENSNCLEFNHALWLELQAKIVIE